MRLDFCFHSPTAPEIPLSVPNPQGDRFYRHCEGATPVFFLKRRLK